MTVELELGLAAAESGPRTLAPLGRRLCEVIENRRCGAYDVIALDDLDGPDPQPGQFYMLAAEHGWGEDRQGQRPYLARAFSYCRSRGTRREFILERIGPGTERLGSLRAAERVWIVGPLGIGFTSTDGADALLVGGGIGIAPLICWSEQLVGHGGQPATLLGFRSAEHAAAAELIAGPVDLATDDGSVGHRGLVTELLEARLKEGERPIVYGCGPPAMLEAVRGLCVSHGVEAQLALEAGMACGFGACFGCVVRTKAGYRRLCVDGPVVRADELHAEWN